MWYVAAVVVNDMWAETRITLMFRMLDGSSTSSRQ